MRLLFGSVLLFNNVVERSVTEKIFVKIENNTLLGHLGTFGHFSDLRNDFRSSHSPGDLLTVVVDKITKAFNMAGTA